MKLSTNFVKDYVDIDVDLKTIAEGAGVDLIDHALLPPGALHIDASSVSPLSPQRPLRRL